MNKGDQLLQRVLSNPRDGVLLNDLLGELCKGYPIENLRPLLLSENERIVEAGIWLTEEMGIAGKPLFENTVELLSHSSSLVRSTAIDSILTCSTKYDGPAIAKVLLLLDDPESSVRYKATGFLSRASADQLISVLSCIEVMVNSSVHRKGVQLLLDKDDVDENDVLSFIRSENSVLRKYGVAATVRMVNRTDEPLKFALSSEDEEIRAFAKDEFKLINLKRSRLRRKVT